MSCPYLVQIRKGRVGEKIVKEVCSIVGGPCFSETTPRSCLRRLFAEDYELKHQVKADTESPPQ